MVSISTFPGWADNAAQGFKRGEIAAIAIPASIDATSRLSAMQTIAKPTGPGIKLTAQFRKQDSKFMRVIRKLRTVEARCVRNA